MKVIREETKQECQGEGVATTDEEVGEDSSRGTTEGGATRATGTRATAEEEEATPEGEDGVAEEERRKHQERKGRGRRRMSPEGWHEGSGWKKRRWQGEVRERALGGGEAAEEEEQEQEQEEEEHLGEGTGQSRQPRFGGHRRRHWSS